MLLFLFWLGHAASFRVVSRTFDIPKSSVHVIVHRVSNAIIRILRTVIAFPTGDDLVAVGEGFALLAGSPAFSSAVGAIDGCHIRLKPPATTAQCYLNRKLFHSIQLQAITDHLGKFIDVFVGYPGSVHDARVLRNSPVYTGGLYPPAGKCILGDGGYPCLSAPICLITPYREPVQNPLQARFNSKHSRARNIVERAFGMMKTRWRSVFFKAMEVSPSFVPEVIACCVCSTISLFKMGTSLRQRLGRIMMMPLLKPATPKQDQENMCGPIWLLLYLLQTFVFLLSMTMTTCETLHIT